MREKINHLALGDIDLVSPVLQIEPSYIEQFVKANSVTRVEINIETKNKIPFKTLLYSDNYRIRFVNTNLAGMNEKVIFDVDTTYLDDFSIIEGKLSLVTNSGEIFIPYKFTVFSTKADKMLSELKKVEDFLYLYKEDRDTALKIFEYKDFNKAPFMQDLLYLATYKSFSVKDISILDLEEFLISIKAKDRVDFSLKNKEILYKNIKEDIFVSVEILKNTYGYAYLQVEADKDFIVLENDKISDLEFVDDKYILNFKILADKLKESINIAVLKIHNMYTDLEIKICIDNSVYIPEEKYIDLEDKKRYFAYLKYRLTYEYADLEEKEILPELMRIELEEIKKDYSYYNSIQVLIAETYFMENNYDKVKEYIDKVKVYFKSDEKLFSDEDLLIEYMIASMNEDEVKLKSLSDLVSSLTYTKDRKFIFLLDMYLKESIRTSLALKYEYIIKEFNRGNRSPFLYMAYINLLNLEPVFLHDLEEVELLSLIFGIKNDFISENLLEVLNSRIKSLGAHTNLKYIFLNLLAKKYKNDVYVEAICNYAIKNNLKDSRVNKWFFEAIKRDIKLNYIYEYYIYSLADDEFRLDEKILYYFLGNFNIDTKYRVKIYENILKVYSENDELYKLYIEDIKRFTFISLKTAKLDEHYAYLYDTILNIENLDTDMAVNLANMLCAYKVKVNNKSIKSLTIIYPELKKEKVYNLNNTFTYIFLCSKSANILVTDINNNKYACFGIELEKLFNTDKLENNIYKIYKTQGIVKLEYIKSLLLKNNLSFEEIKFLEESIKDSDLSEDFKKSIFLCLIKYYSSNTLDLSNIGAWNRKNYDILMSANKENLTSCERNIFIDALIMLGYFNEAYEALKKYKSFNILKTNIDKLVEKMILDKLFKNDSLFMYLSVLSFLNANKSRVLLDYLCKYFNGSNKEMYNVLEVAVSENVETYDLEERLLAQLLFTDDKEYIDKVFAFYVGRKKVNDTLIKAYFTAKSREYILYDEALFDDFIEYIENSIFADVGTNKSPLVYKIAILKYYSKCEKLEDIQIEYAKTILDDLILRGLEFPFYKELARFIMVPNEILNREYIVYIAKYRENPVLYTRINDTSFVKEKFFPMYQNMYIKSVLLFADETLEYKICNDDIDGEVLKSSEILAKHKNFNLKNKFDYINKIVISENEVKLEENLRNFIFKEEISKKMFDLM